MNFIPIYDHKKIFGFLVFKKLRKLYDYSRFLIVFPPVMCESGYLEYKSESTPSLLNPQVLDMDGKRLSREEVKNS